MRSWFSARLLSGTWLVKPLQRTYVLNGYPDYNPGDVFPHQDRSPLVGRYRQWRTQPSTKRMLKAVRSISS